MELPDYDYGPVLSCYISDTGKVWVLVDQAVPPYPGCALVIGSDGTRWAQIARAPVGWLYYIAAVF